jgi:hypothetical protein
MMNSRLLVFILIILNGSLFGQLSVEQYLSAPFQQAEIEGLAMQMEYLENESFRSPLFRELEIRLRSNDFNLSPEDYRIRLGFINPFERRANKSYTEMQAEFFETKYDYETNLILANRYKQLITHYFLDRELQLMDQDLEMLRIGFEQLQNEKFSLKLIIETDEKILKRELQKKDIQTIKEILEHYFQEIHGINDSLNWDGFDMISVATIKSNMLIDTAMRSKELELAMKSLQLEEQSYKIEKAESFSNIGFFQVEYDTDRGKELNDHMGFQLGIQLPVFNRDKPQLQREKLELIEAEYDLKDLENQSEIQRFNLNKRLLEQIWSHEVVSSRIQRFETLGQDLSYDDIEDFIALITYLGNLNMLRNDIYQECLNTYLDLLAMSGVLAEQPFVNYLQEE